MELWVLRSNPTMVWCDKKRFSRVSNLRHDQHPVRLVVRHHPAVAVRLVHRLSLHQLQTLDVQQPAVGQRVRRPRRRGTGSGQRGTDVTSGGRQPGTQKPDLLLK
jgi:hypothetical protein